MNTQGESMDKQTVSPMDKPCVSCAGQGRYPTGWDCIACNGTGKATLMTCSRIDHRDVQYEMWYGCWKCGKEDDDREEEEMNGPDLPTKQEEKELDKIIDGEADVIEKDPYIREIEKPNDALVDEGY